MVEISFDSNLSAKARYEQAKQAVSRLEAPLVLMAAAGALAIMAAGLSAGMHPEQIAETREALLVFTAVGLSLVEGAAVGFAVVIPALPSFGRLQEAKRDFLRR